MSTCRTAFNGTWHGRYPGIQDGILVIRIAVDPPASFAGRLFQNQEPKAAIAASLIECPPQIPEFGRPMIVRYNVTPIGLSSVLRTGVLVLQAIPPFYVSGSYQEDDGSSGNLVLTNLPLPGAQFDETKFSHLLDF